MSTSRATLWPGRHFAHGCATINTGITCVESYCCLACCFCLFHNRKHLFQCHLCAVINSTNILCVLQKFWIYQRSCINNYVRFFQIFLSSYGDQIRCSEPALRNESWLSLLFHYNFYYAAKFYNSCFNKFLLCLHWFSFTLSYFSFTMINE